MSERRPRIIKQAELEANGGRLTRIAGSEPEVGALVTPRAEVTVEDAGECAVSAEGERMRRLVQAMLGGFARQRREMLVELQPQVVRIAVEVARRVVRRELLTDPGMIGRTVQSALEQVAAASHARVRVHPLDAQVLQATIRELLPASDEAASVEIIPDGSIERGGCVIESDRGIVDARLETQFEEMQARLLDGLERLRAHEEGAR